MVHSHGHSHEESIGRALWLAFGLNAFFLLVEFVGGLLTGSLALLSDAGHMLSDVGALGLAGVAARLARRRPSKRRTYGYGRAEVLAALINGLTLWLIVGAIFLEAGKRLIDPPEVQSVPMLIVASLGLGVNIASALVLFRHRGEDMNIRGAFLHLVADSLSSVGVIIAGVLMWRLNWFFVDPLASFLIGILILVASWELVRESIHVLLEGSPRHLDSEEVRAKLERIDGVESCHDLHIWLIGSGEPILTAHLDAVADADRTRILNEATAMLSEGYDITHVTLQIEKGINHADLHP